MKEEQQRIAIAEACGWKFQHPSPNNGSPEWSEMKCNAILCWVRPGGGSWQLEELPDYLNDLNAMHEAEKVLFQDYSKWELFVSHLRSIGFRGDSLCDHCVFATASQRAEAFLKTLNLWTES